MLVRFSRACHRSSSVCKFEDAANGLCIAIQLRGDFWTYLHDVFRDNNKLDVKNEWATSNRTKIRNIVNKFYQEIPFSGLIKKERTITPFCNRCQKSFTAQTFCMNAQTSSDRELTPSRLWLKLSEENSPILNGHKSIPRNMNTQVRTWRREYLKKRG